MNNFCLLRKTITIKGKEGEKSKRDKRKMTFIFYTDQFRTRLSLWFRETRRLLRNSGRDLNAL